MTEAEWLACQDPEPMRIFLFESGSDNSHQVGRLSLRQGTLLGAACCRRLRFVDADEVNRTWVAIVERKADGLLDEGEYAATRHACRVAAEHALAGCRGDVNDRSPNDGDAAYCATEAVSLLLHMTDPSLTKFILQLCGEAAWYARKHDAEGTETRAQSDILRDIVGNPFRPSIFSPLWRTDTAMTLAARMYEARDFSAMPILADALQDAGCADENILSHCRGPGPHVRGCWVVDLVLGKE